MNFKEIFIKGYIIPKPLPKQELYLLLAGSQHGDIKAKNKLIECNLRLVFYEVIGRFKNVEYDKRDLVSIGTFGLIKAIDNFDAKKNIEFSTYAIRCIDNEILMFLRKLKRVRRENISTLETPIMGYNDGHQVRFEDIINCKIDIAEECENNDLYQRIHQILKDLPDRDREIIMMYFGFYNDIVYSQSEIANKFSISQSQVSKLITKILKKIGYQLQQEGSITSKIMDKNNIKKEENKIKKLK